MAAVLLAGTVIACHPPGSHGPAMGAITVRGHVQIASSAEMPDVVLIPDADHATLFLRGPQTELLKKVDGLGVAVVGARTGQTMVVDHFTVISANGLPATDGRLTARGDTLVLTSADGVAHPLVHPSPVLRAHIGSRAWIAGPIDKEPVSYGIVQ
jgi:hypothetical protein